MSDFDEQVCAVCGGKAIRLGNGICQDCFLNDQASHTRSASDIGESFGSALDEKFDMLWRIIRRQGERIKVLEDLAKEKGIRQ